MTADSTISIQVKAGITGDRGTPADVSRTDLRHYSKLANNELKRASQ